MISSNPVYGYCDAIVKNCLVHTAHIDSHYERRPFLSSATGSSFWFRSAGSRDVWHGLAWLGSRNGPCFHAHCYYSFRRPWNPFAGIFHLLHPEGQVSAPKLPCVIQHADTKDAQTVYCLSCFGIYGNRNSRHDCLRLSSSRPGSCLGRYRGRTPFPSPRQDFSAGPLLFLGNRDNALVRCLRHFVPFQFARSVEQQRDGRSALG